MHENSCYDNEHRSDGSSRSHDNYSCGANTPIREKKYSGLEAAAAAQQKRKGEVPARDSLNSRYSSDPCKVIGPREEEEVPVMPAPPTPLGGDNKRLKEEDGIDMEVKIPVDEDDYLQPKSTHPVAYMDLVNDTTAPGNECPLHRRI